MSENIFSKLEIDTIHTICDKVDQFAEQIDWWATEWERIASHAKAMSLVGSYDKALDKALKYMKLDKEVGRSELKRVYKQIAKQVHPDRGGDSKEFQTLQENLKIIEDYIDGNKRLNSIGK